MNRPMSPRILGIIRDACVELGVSVRDVLSDVRTKHVVEARHRAMRAIDEQTAYSLPQIGRIFGRDHTTVLNALRKTRRELAPLPPPPIPVTSDELPRAVMRIPGLSDLPPIAIRHRRRVISPHKLSLAQRLYLSERASVARLLFVCGPTHGPKPFSRFEIAEPTAQVCQDRARQSSNTEHSKSLPSADPIQQKDEPRCRLTTSGNRPIEPSRELVL